MEDTSVDTETTVTDSQSVEQTEINTSSEDTETQETETETTDDSSEETENTEAEIKEPKSKANERIRDLIKKLHDKDAEIESLRKSQPEIQGISDDGVEVDKLFNSAVNKAMNDLAQAKTSNEISEARQDLAKQAVVTFDYMKEPIWQEEAQAIMDRNPKIDPFTAAEMVGRKIAYLRGETEKKIAKQVKADKALKESTFTPSGTQPNTTDGFSPEDIAAMSTTEYEKNKAKILKQFGIRANL